MASEFQQPSLRRRAPLAIAALIFLLALALRIANAPFAFGNGIPLISPLDELYHWKRITWSALHFPGVLGFDVDRGVRGAFCPWPPLYDLLAGGTARLLGAHDAFGVLVRAVWFPPILGALFAAIAAAIIAKFSGSRAATACGIALAASPYVITPSWIGSIDHHWLEWPLTFAILGATCLALRTSKAAIAGILLGAAITAAMFVQTALLIPAGLAFLVLFAFTDGRAAAVAFGMATAAVALYRITRLPGYPDNQWFLGWTHVALFAGAAVASVVAAALGRRAAGGGARRHTKALALLIGALAAAAIPTALGSIVGGIRFFGGETWLHTIEEFQPLWRARGEDLLSYAVGLGAGTIFVWPLTWRSIRRRELVTGTVAFFAIVHLLLTISSRRFTNAGIPLLALAGALWAASIVRPRAAMLALALIAIPPPVQFALWMRHPDSVIPSRVVPWVRAARFLHDQRAPGRVLAPWSMGHVIDVIGERAVIVDNFGTMPDEVTFDRAHDAFLQLDETMLARYCRDNGVRYIVLDHPLLGLTASASVLGIDPNLYVRITGGSPPFFVTRLARATWWWRAYYRLYAPERFRLVYADPQPFADKTPFRGPSIAIWEFRDAVR